MQAARDENRIPALIGVASTDGITPTSVYVDPTTHRLYADVSISSATVTGTKTNNNAVPGAINIGALVGIANAAAPTYTEGNQVLLSTDLSGALRVTGSLSVGGTTDNSAYTAGTSTGTPAMGFYHSIIDTVTDNRAATIAITSKRAMMVNLQTSAGVETGVAAAPLQVSLANTAANATAVKVDGSAVTQPVSIAANVTVVGTGTFATQATLAAETTKVIGTINIAAAQTLATVSTVTAVSDAQVQGKAASGAAKAGNPVQVGGVFNTTQPTVTTGQAVELQATARGAAIVATSVDTFNVTVNAALPTGSNVIGALSANQSVNVAQINGVAVLMGNGITGTGSQRVTLASDNTAIAGWGHGATGSAVPSGAQYKGLLAKTANPTAATDGNMVGAMADKLGRQVVVLGNVRDLKGNQLTTITSSVVETTVVTAVVSTFLDVYGCIVENTSATGTKVTFKDSTAGTTQFEIYVPANETRGFMLPSSDGFKQTTVNTAWTATCGTSVASIVITMLYVKNI